MVDQARTITFENWIEILFGEAVIHRDDPSDWRDDLPALLALQYSARLFEGAGALLERFSDRDINQGLLGIIDSQLEALLDQATPDVERIRFINSIETVYVEVFARRCARVLGHRDEPGDKPLNEVCYMWWDVFPTWGMPKKPWLHAMDAAVIDLLRRLLAIEHDACIESTLHGLGHWQLHYPQEVATIIDAFLSQAIRLRPELRDYAVSARSGIVL